LLQKFDEKRTGIDKLKDDDHIEFEMSVKQEQQKIGIEQKPSLLFEICSWQQF
jgi:hypothetical protein